MDRSLINPNQCRHYGIPICDDPTDPHRNLGIQLNDNLFLPLQMKGTTCYFVSRCPLIRELESCQTFQISDPQHWDPTENMFVCSVGRGKMRVQNPNCHCFDYIHDFDKITESPTHTIGQIHTLARHHGTDVNLLSQKWGIGIEKARNTLKHTTRLNIRSALLPLTRRYRTDLLSQR